MVKKTYTDQRFNFGVFVEWTRRIGIESSCTYDQFFSKIKRLETTDEKGGSLWLNQSKLIRSLLHLANF